MSKKDFKGGLNSLLAETGTPERKKEGRSKASAEVPEKTSETGTKSGETRATFIVEKSVLQKIKDLAYWERLQIKEVVGTALIQHIERYEKKHGELKKSKA